MFTISAVSYALVMFTGGVLADRLPLNILLAVATAGLSGTILTLLHVSSVWTSQIFAGMMGIGQGMLAAVSALLWSCAFGKNSRIIGHCGCGSFQYGTVFDGRWA
jgi:MFS family permease